MSVLESITLCAERVQSELGGLDLPEKYYQRALSEELRECFSCIQLEYLLECYYTTSNNRRVQLGNNRADILVNQEIIVEVKTLKYFQKTKKAAESQCKRYLKFLNKNVCYLVIFNSNDPEGECIVREYHRD